MALLDKEILNEENKRDLAKFKEIISDMGLSWNWGSMQAVLFEYDTNLESLREYDGKFKNITIMILAGLPENQRNKDRAFEVLTEITSKGIGIMRAHRFFVEVLQERHFFTDTKEEELTRNLIEADKTDQMTLQNLISSLILKEAIKESYQYMNE